VDGGVWAGIAGADGGGGPCGRRGLGGGGGGGGAVSSVGLAHRYLLPPLSSPAP